MVSLREGVLRHQQPLRGRAPEDAAHELSRTRGAAGAKAAEREAHAAATEALHLLGALKTIVGEIAEPSAGATAKAPSNVEVLGSGPPRAADLDLDPSAIAASLGTSSAGADAYEQVQDTAEALSRAMSGGVSAASKGSTAGSFGDALEGGSSDESSERRRRRKKKEKKSAEKSAKSSRKSKKAEKEEKPATESASKGKKKKKAVKDWDESDSD